jgi:hypothetical protein
MTEVNVKQSRGSLALILTWALFGSPAFAAQDVSFKSSPLKGIRTVAVLVEKLSEDGMKIGLTAERIQTAAERSLKREGIAIANTATYPCLYIKINVIESAYSIRMEVREQATLTRIPLSFRVTTWYAESTGTHGGDSNPIIVALEERLNGFITDYYKANPKN